MSSLTVRPTDTLWAIEETLDALLNSVDLVETPEEQALIKTEIAETLERAVAKRDQVAAWLGREESFIAAIDAELDRLVALKRRRANAISNIEEYLVSIILAKGPDAKGRLPKLEGFTSRFSVRKNPAALEITDESAIPDDYARVELELTAREWIEFTDSLDIETSNALAKFIKARRPDKREIKMALANGEVVAGAQIAPAKYRLERE